MTLTRNDALAEEQSHLLDALAGQQSAAAGTFNSRGLQVYQANRAVLAERTLASTYPVSCQLIGVESFEPRARHFWRQHPPVRGDMGQWGAQLAEFLDNAPQLQTSHFWATWRAPSGRCTALPLRQTLCLTLPHLRCCQKREMRSVSVW